MNKHNHYELNKHHYPQAWLLLISVVSFGAYIIWDLKFFAMILSLDRSYMASLTMALVVFATAHCGWHIIHYSNRIAQLQHWLRQADIPAKRTPGFLSNYLDDLESTRASASSVNTDDSILNIQAERVRSPVELGWFFVDLAIRLGLLGTIIGFILIFASLTDINIQGGDELKDLLIAMSGGMGTALLTTLTGLVAASILSFQYLILGNEAEHLVALLLRVRHRYYDSASQRLLSTTRTSEESSSPPTTKGPEFPAGAEPL